MKTCPFCSEEIQDKAIKCKHCGEMLGSLPPGVGTGTLGHGTQPPVDAAHSQTELAAVDISTSGTVAASHAGTGLPATQAPPAQAPLVQAPGLAMGELPAGFELGNFVIQEAIGKGGMGEVYRARHKNINREVAVKVLAPALSDHPEALERFRREADMANSVRHQAVVKVHDFGHLPDGRTYYFMDLLRGESLSDYLEKRGRIDLPESASIITPVIDALGAAHVAGIIHRDVKPDNIFLDTGHQGERIIRVLDFGIAKLSGPTVSDVSVTVTGQILGTPLYMSPEQVDGSSSDIGPHSDVYTVGAVLFHMLTGSPPVSGGNFQQLIVRKVTQEAPAVRTLRPDLPPALEQILSRCLAITPNLRYPGMPELKGALMNEVGGWAEAAGPTGSGSMPIVTPMPTGAQAVSAPGAAQGAAGESPPRSLQTSLSGAAAQQVVVKHTRGSKGLSVGLLAGLGLAVVAIVVIVGVVLMRDKIFGEETSKKPKATAAAPKQPRVTTPPPRRRTDGRIPGTRGSRMARMAPGCFQMGRTGLDPDEVPVHKVCLDGFYMDRTEATVADYDRCIKAGACSAPRPYSTEKKWKRRCNWKAAGRDQHPVNCLTWYQAKSYCAWAGKRLPTEAEWEYAARGTDNRMYPWGNEQPSCERVIMGRGDGKGCGKGGTWPVGSKPKGASPQGLVDLAGNVWEWTADCWYLKSYQKCAAGCKNPRHVCEDPGRKRVIRGASFSYGAAKAKSFRTSLRGYYKPNAVGQGVGVRCARNLGSVSQTEQWLDVPAGCFVQGSNAGDGDEKPAHQVCLSAFKMSRTEITVNQFARCVNAGKCQLPTAFMDDADKWQSFCNHGAPGRASHPVNCLTWFQAQAYCQYRGGRLPTEAEWEYAARGKSSRLYPWGTHLPSCKTAVMQNHLGKGCGTGRTQPVGSKPAGASPFGLLDMTGNVWEWIYDCYDKHAYSSCAPPCRDPRSEPCKPGGKRLKRGVSYGNGMKSIESFRTSFRGTWKYAGLSPRIGLRCVIPAKK